MHSRAELSRIGPAVLLQLDQEHHAFAVPDVLGLVLDRRKMQRSMGRVGEQVYPRRLSPPRGGEGENRRVVRLTGPRD